MSFRKNFAWGVATASYQIEGAFNEDGKGLGIWDVYSHIDGKIADNHNGDVACDHYHRFKDDVKLMKELGIKAYRFSLSWPRILPDGTGRVNEKGVKFYSDLIDELLSNGIEPYITLFHWDLPYEIHKKGGWLNDKSVEWFAEYAGKVSELFSDRVKYFMTFNEPQCFIGLGYMTGVFAPGLKSTYKDYFTMCHNVLKAHGAAVIALRKNAKNDIKVGYAPTGSVCYPEKETPEFPPSPLSAQRISKRHAKTILVAQIWMMVFFGMFHGGAILLSLENILKTVLKNTKSIFLKLQKKI